MTDFVVLLTSGLVAGLLGGLLGIGGGIMLMPVLRFGVGLSPAMAAGTCVLGVFCTTLGGSFRYYQQGLLKVRGLVPVILAGSISTLACSFVFGYLAVRGRWLDLGIGIVFLLIAGRMVLEGVGGTGRRRSEAEAEVQQGEGGIEGSRLQLGVIGAAGGILPGLLGLGTGGILVPAFTFWLRAPIKVAMATSLCCFCFNAALSSVVKFAQGFVALEIALPICLGTLIGANLGALVNKRTHSGWLKLLFGALFAFVAVRFLWSFWR